MKRILLALFLLATPLGAQQQPPVAYQPQLISYPGIPSGTCQIYQAALNSNNGNYYLCNPATNTWVAAGGVGSAKGSVDVTASPYNAKFDVHWGTIYTITNTSNVITGCSDCNFQGTDILGRPYAVVGQIVWATTSTSDVSLGVYATPECVISSIDSNTGIHMGTIGAPATPCNATSSVTGHLFWGDLDSASSTQTQSTANDPIFNAWTAATNSCAQFAAPVGATFVEQGEWITYNTARVCASQISAVGDRFGLSVKGQGRNATYVIPTPNFLATSCTGPNGAGSTCLFAFQNENVSDLQVNGGGAATCGAGFNGKNLTGVLGNSYNNGSNALWRNVMLLGWCGSSPAGSIGMNLGLAVPISGAEMEDVWVENFACNPVLAAVNTGWHFGEYWSNAGCDAILKVTGGTFRSSQGIHCGGTGANPCVLLSSGATYYTTDDSLNSQGNNLINSNGGAVHIKGSNLSGGGHIIECKTTTCNLFVSDMVSAAGTVAFFADAGTTLNIFDGGNNTWTIAAQGTGTVNQFGFASFVGVAAAASNIALGAGYGTSSVGTFVGTDPKHFTFTLTLAGTLTLATETITYTYPTTENGNLAAPFGSCTAKPVGGTQFAAAAYSFLTTTLPSTTSVVFTQQTAAGTAGNTEIISVDCG